VQPDISKVTMGILDRFRAAFGWVRAYGLSSRGHYDDALTVIRSINAPPTGPRTRLCSQRVVRFGAVVIGMHQQPHIESLSTNSAVGHLRACGHRCEQRGLSQVG
jgi:hypothetical protein